MSNPNPSSTPPQPKITANRYEGLEEKEVEHINKGKAIDLAWCIVYFGNRGKETYGEKFKIHEEDYEILYKLIIYFLAHQEEAKRLNIDLSKGILLTGPVGCGKTSLMNLMRLIPPIEKHYMIKTCRDISFEFIQEGYEVINRYSKLSFRDSNTPKAYCFDDLGAEQNLKYYGNECNVMGEILLSRYDLLNHGMIAHCTSNLSSSEILSLYGQRVRSRMRSMFNLIPYAGQASDKRT